MATSIKTYTVIPNKTNSSSYVSILSSITDSSSGYTWSVPYNQDNSEKLQFLGASLISTTLGSWNTKITKIRVNYEDKVSNSSVKAHCCFWLGRSSVDGDGPDSSNNVFTMSSPYEYYDNYNPAKPWNSSSYTVWETESGTRSTSFTAREVVLYSNTDYTGVQLTAEDFSSGGRGLIIGLGTVNNSMQSCDLTVRNIKVTIEYEAEVETCTVTVGSNNTSQGYVSGGAANIELGTSVTIEATPYSGYIFNYWLSDSGVYQFTSTYTYNATEDAHWTAYFTQDTPTTTYTIQFNGNGYTGGSLPPTITAQGSSTSVTMGDITSDVPTKTGYIFRGWSSTSSYSSNRIAWTESYGGSADSNGIKATTTGSSWTYQNYCNYTGYTGSSTTLTLYAQWEADTTATTYILTVKGDLNGNDSYSSISPSVGSYSYKAGDTISLSATLKSGYDVEGWVYKNDSDTAWNYIVTDSLTGTYTMPAENITIALYTQKTTTTYTIQFNGNGHTGGSLPPTMTAEGTSTSVTMGDITSAVPTKTGYTFRGWSSTSSYNSKRIAYNSSYGGSADRNGVSATTTGNWTYQNYCNYTGYTGSSTTLTLYAQWEKNTYIVSYDKGTYGSGTNTTDTKTHGTSLTLKGAIFTRTGYTQTGWASNQAGTTFAYNLNASYTANAAVTLYPYWTINTYTVSYFDKHGATVPSAQTKTYGINLTLSSTKPSRTGYTFSGWDTDSSADTVVYNAGATYSTNAAVTLYAVWTPNSYTYNISYKSTTGVSLGTGTVTKNFGSTYSISPGKNFTGYTTPSAKNVAWDSTSAKTITFEYTPINYTIEYVLNGGSASNKTSYNIETTSFTLNNPTKKGNTFKGWSGTGLTGDSNTSVTISKGSTGNRSYEANWTINSYQFTLGSATHVNTTGSTTSGSKQYGSTITLKATVDAGYTFGGWSSSNTNLIGNQSSANVSFSMPAGAITMTPSVSANQYTITYDIASNANSGDTLTNKPSTQTYSYTGGTVTITSTIPKRTGYTFAGWCRSSNSTSNLLSSGANINQTTSNITLYAVWKKDIEITYNINEGIGTTPTKQSATIYNKNTGATFSLATNDGFLNQGYKFIGWSTTKNDSSTQVSTSTSFIASTTLYALWEIQYYSLTTNIYTNGVDSDNGNSISSPTLVSGSTQSGKYAYGSEIKLTATAVDPYDFESWSQNGIDKGSGTLSDNNNKSECNFTITEDTTIIANFATGTISARFYCYDITSGSPVLQTSATSKVKLWVRSKVASASTYGAWEQKSFSTKMTYSDSTYIQVLIENGEEYEFNSGTGINFAYTIPNQLTDILIQSDQNFSIPCKQIKVENHIKVNDVLKTSGYIKDPYFSMDENIASIWIGDKQIMGQVPSEIYPYKEDSLLIDTLYINNQNTILNKSYQNNTSIKKIIIPKNITTIGANYLRSCTNLKTVKFLQNSQLTSLGNYAFAEDNNLLKIYLPNQLTNIGEGAFQECTRLQKIVLPKTISTIQQYAFYNCANLQSLKLNHTTITELPYSLFMYCSKLKTVFLPKTLTTIGTRVFYQCTSLEKIIYMGTIEDWNKIQIPSYGNTYLNGVPIQCIDGITYTNLE